VLPLVPQQRRCQLRTLQVPSVLDVCCSALRPTTAAPIVGAAAHLTTADASVAASTAAAPATHGAMHG
jgi:hypothetical protein